MKNENNWLMDLDNFLNFLSEISLIILEKKLII